MKIYSYVIFFILLLSSCSHFNTRAPASPLLSQCRDSLFSLLRVNKNNFKILQVPKNTRTYKMLRQFKGEEQLTKERPVRYLNEEERKNYEIFINEDGLAVNSQGLPLTSPMKGNRPAEAIYVISPDGRFYVSYLTPDDRFQHSSFLAGSEVIAAGQITFHNGTIQTLSNESGHYFPSIDSLDNLITILENRSVKIMNVLVAGDD